MSGLDIIAQSCIQNQDNIIETSPISVTIEIIKRSASTSGMFGYEEIVAKEQVVRSKGIIKYNPSRSFLKANGVFFENNELPIIAFFKYSDGIQRGDIIKSVMRDKDVEFKEEFHVVDVKTKGFSQTQNKFYVLAPVRRIGSIQP